MGSQQGSAGERESSAEPAGCIPGEQLAGAWQRRALVCVVHCSWSPPLCLQPIFRYPLSYISYHTFSFTGFMRNEFEVGEGACVRGTVNGLLGSINATLAPPASNLHRVAGPCKLLMPSCLFLLLLYSTAR